MSAAAKVPAELDVRELRSRRGLSREQFAMRYGLDLESLRTWEAGRRTRDATARSYLRPVSNDLEGVERAYALYDLCAGRLIRRGPAGRRWTRLRR